MPFRSQFNSNEEYNAYFREYRKKNLEKLKAYKRKYNSEWRKKFGYHSETKWKIEHPKEVKAQYKLRYYVKRGVVKKEPCITCGDEKSVGHHPDYNKPLEVIWVCRLHHRQIHYTKKVDKSY